MKIYDLIVVGGGPAGMIAAGHAAESGLKVLLLEKMSKTGRKLGITGKGRCNITNTAPLDEHIDRIKPDGRFLRSAYSRFFNSELIDFMHSIGIETDNERGGRVFPKNGKATDIVRKLDSWVRQKGVEIQCNTSVNRILKKDERVYGVEASQLPGRESFVTYRSDSVLVATGGLSYPATGSTGDGYRLAGNLNHELSPRFPALVPLETNSKYLSLLKGLNLRNVSARLYIEGELRNEDFGEMSFLDNSLSGPIILRLSRDIGDILQERYHVVLKLDLKPALDEQKLDKRLIRDLEKYSKLEIYDILRKLMPSPLVKMCVTQLAINSRQRGSEITTVLRSRIVRWIKEVKFTITGCRPYSEAIITSGGIKLDQIEQNTLMSKLQKGLYFAGEILDLDGPTGGYNLQIAFSTGWCAAEGVIKNRDKNIAVM